MKHNNKFKEDETRFMLSDPSTIKIIKKSKQNSIPEIKLNFRCPKGTVDDTFSCGKTPKKSNKSISVDITVPTQKALENFIQGDNENDPLPWDEDYNVKMGSKIYQIRLEGWYDDCLESRGYDDIDPSDYKDIIKNDFKNIVLDESGWDKSNSRDYIFGYIPDVKGTTYGVTYIGRPIKIKQNSTPLIKQKENSSIVSRTGFVVEEQNPIDRFPEKTFGNVRQDEIPELVNRAEHVEIDNVEILEPEIDDVVEDVEINPIEESLKESDSEFPNFTVDKARTKLIQWATKEDGSINKKPLLKWFLDIDGGSAQTLDSYRYPTGYVIDDQPQYCRLSLDKSWDLAAGKETGIANRNIQKKIIFIKNREGIPLTEEQFDFTERHMSSEKVDYHVLEDGNSPGGIDFIPETELKLNSSPAGSKVIYEDNDIIDVPVIPMREGVFTGSDGIPTLKKFEYFGKDAHWLEGQPILKGHTKPTEMVTYKHNRIGKLMNVTARPDKKDVVAVARYYKEKLSPEDLNRIKSGNPYDGSIAYTTHTSFTEGDYNGQKYNAVEDGGYHFYHFAELANGTGACSSSQGCGFMLNESPDVEVKLNETETSVNTLDSFYNELRRADIEFNGSGYSVKLNSKTGGNGIMATSDRMEANEWAKMYVSKGLIPIEMKQNYNCPDAEKSGSGKGSCGGSEGKEDKKSSGGKKSPITMVREGGETAMLLKIPGKSVDKSDEMATFIYKGPGKKMEVIPPVSELAKDSHQSSEWWNKVVSGEIDKVGAQDFLGKKRDEYETYAKNTGDKKAVAGALKAINNDLKKLQGFPDLKYGAFDGEGNPLSEKVMKDILGKSGNEMWTPQQKAQYEGARKSMTPKEKKEFMEFQSKKSRQKRNSRSQNNYNTIGNNMTEEYIQAETSVEDSEEIVQKMNEAFEQKLNERDSRIKELETQVDDLVQKQNAAEEAIIAEKARVDFEAFTMKLNKAHQKDAQVHYDGFKSDGWAYFDAHPGVFKADEIVKMNSVGVAAAEGDSAFSSLQNAREMLKKSQKERFSKRV